MAMVLVDVGVILAAVPLMIKISLSLSIVVTLTIPRKIVGIFMIVHLRILPTMFHVVVLEEVEVVVTLEDSLVFILLFLHPQISYLQHLLVLVMVGDCPNQRLKFFVFLLLNLIFLLQLPPPPLRTSILGLALSTSVSSSQAS